LILDAKQVTNAKMRNSYSSLFLSKRKSTQIANPLNHKKKKKKIFGNLLGEEGGVREQI